MTHRQSPIMLVDGRGGVRPFDGAVSDRRVLRLICFSHAGGLSSVFYPWARRLPRAVEVGVVQLPGRGARIAEAPFKDVRSVVAEVAPVLRAYGNASFVLFGHSMGALLAFELARALKSSDVRPRALIVSGARAPHVTVRETALHRLPDAALVTEMAERYNRVPASLLNDAEALELFLPPLRADLELLETYAHQPGEPLDCPLFAFGGATDAEVSGGDLLRWREQTRQAFRAQLFPGGHFYLYERPNFFFEALGIELRALAEAMATDTRDCQR